MPLNSNQSFAFYALTIILAIILRIAPWPEFVQEFNPDWVLLVLIYWCLAIPERVGIFNAWVIGLLTDVLIGRMLGQYALAYSFASFLCLNLHKRLRQYPPFQQGLFIFFILQFSLLVIFWTENLFSPTAFQISFWLPSVTGTACWPLVFTLLRSVRSGRSKTDRQS